jgi:hypothetical protein
MLNIKDPNTFLGGQNVHNLIIIGMLGFLIYKAVKKYQLTNIKQKIMCGCTSNFDGNRPSEIVEDNNDLLNFGGEMGEFDNFLTKKSRERRRVQKELMAGGLGKADAKTQALAQVPKDKLREVIAKLKAGKSVISIDTPSGVVNLSNDPTKALDEVSNALADAGGKTANDTTPDATATEKTFLQKNGLYIGIAVVVLVGGFFAYKKFGK